MIHPSLPPSSHSLTSIRRSIPWFHSRFRLLKHNMSTSREEISVTTVSIDCPHQHRPSNDSTVKAFSERLRGEINGCRKVHCAATSRTPGLACPSESLPSSAISRKTQSPVTVAERINHLRHFFSTRLGGLDRQFDLRYSLLKEYDKAETRNPQESVAALLTLPGTRSMANFSATMPYSLEAICLKYLSNYW